MTSIKEQFRHIRNLRRSTQGKNALIFMAFLVVSACLWFVMSINDEFQREIEIPVELTEFPDSITLLSPTPHVISASVKGRGNTLLRYEWGEISPIKIRYRDFSSHDGRLVMGENQIISVLRNYFGGNTQIISAKPDSIALRYTTLPGHKVAVKINLKVTTDPGAVISGRMLMSQDSVLLYSSNEIPRNLSAIETNADEYSDLTDTTNVTVMLRVPAGMRAIPDRINVTIPVEPLISKARTVPIEVINVPYGESVVTFPSQTTVTYLLPMSMYNKDDYPIKVVADYNKISPLREVTKVPLEPLSLPAMYHNATIPQDSVEYVIEQSTR